MLNLFDYLTEEDNRKIKNYIHTFAIEDPLYAGNEKYLSYWAENNKKLFHLLGGKLIYKIPYEYNKSVENIHTEVKSLIMSDTFDVFYDFIGEKLGAKKFSVDCDIRQFWKVSIYITNKIDSGMEFGNNTNKKPLKIPAGCKPIRALQKILTYYDADKKIFDALEKFRIELSMITNDKKVSGNLCFSIHPLDFMTMSDNASDWQSCMSWKNEGCYRLGTVEMMNSNNVICVYIENEKKPFEYGEGEHKDTWNNKRWRQLFYCTKEILVSGKSYPYYNEQITKDALQILRTLAFENWKHTYEFGIEPYRDMIHLGSLYRIENNRHWIKTKTQAKKHNIIFDSKAMYNDMFNDNNYKGYWCVRNKVKKNTIISYSGKAPCICCMQTATNLNNQNYIYDEDAYNSRYDNTEDLVCSNCLKKYRCDCCGKFFNVLYETEDNSTYCSKCWSAKMKECPVCHKPMNLSSVESNWRVDMPNFYICDECLDNFENLDISKFFSKQGSLPYWICKDYKECKDNNKLFEIYERDNLKLIPPPVLAEK